MTTPVEIVGSGPAGLSAALAVLRSGGRAIVYEANPEVGHRFQGDFQGIENWTTSMDVLEELAALGIESTFEYKAFRECLFFDAGGREYVCRAELPLWYLVRRGTGPGTLDQALKEQALAAGVEFRFNTTRRHLPSGGIVAHGPRRVDAVAAGYVFETGCADGAFVVASDQLALKGYGYLLVWGGRGTIAACQFADFHNEKQYVERTVEFFREKIGFRMTNPRPFGGFGTLFSAPTARKGCLLYAGEAAGFQDALFGFGMRYALLSGHLAACAWLAGRPETYDRLWKERFGGLLKLAVVNRYSYERFGNRGYARSLRTLCAAPDARDWLRRYYGSGRLRRLIYPLAHRRLANKPELVNGCGEDCDCTWCHCRHGIQTDSDHDPGCGIQIGDGS